MCAAANDDAYGDHTLNPAYGVVRQVDGYKCWNRPDADDAFLARGFILDSHHANDRNNCSLTRYVTAASRIASPTDPSAANTRRSRLTVPAAAT